MNIIHTNIGENTNKLLIIRDVSHILYLKKVIETKRSMSNFTESVLKEVDSQIIHISKSVDYLDRHVDSEGKQLLDDIFYEIQKLNYKMKDYSQIFAISEGKFK